MVMATMTEERVQANDPTPEWHWNGEAWDRRNRPRLDLSYSLCLRRAGGVREVETETVNVSTEGFYFIAPSLFRTQEKVAFEMVMPWHGGGGSPRSEFVLRGRAQVVRVESGKHGTGFGVACRLEADYTIVRRALNSSKHHEPTSVAS